MIAKRNGLGYSSIDDYGVIGDLYGCAGKARRLDRLAVPSPVRLAVGVRGDAGPPEGRVFPDRSGFGQLTSRELYAPDTNVLITRFQAPDGVGEVQDCMPIADDTRGRQRPPDYSTGAVGSVNGGVRPGVSPRFDYARAGHTVEAIDGGVLFRSNGPDGARLALLGTVPLRIVDGAACVRFVIDEGHTETFELHYLPIGAALPRLASREESAQQIEDTIHYWQRWLRGSTYRGRWREVVNRSALTLKLLTYSPTGAIVASPTMGLPEEVGGERNWDYRYTWLRDAALRSTR